MSQVLEGALQIRDVTVSSEAFGWGITVAATLCPNRLERWAEARTGVVSQAK